MNKTIISAWKRLVGLLKLDKRDIFQIFYYAIFAGIVSLSLPLGIQAIINLIQGAQISTSWIVLVVLVTTGVAFVGALQLMQFRIIENLQQKIFTRSSFEFSYRLPKIKMSELRGYYPPELANRFFDTLTVQKGISKLLVDFPAALLQIFFGLILLSLYHPFFIIYGLLLLILIYLVFKFTAQKGFETSLLESKHKYRVAHWLQEVARSIVSFKLSGKTNLAMSKNDALLSDYLSARESHFRILVVQFIQMIGFKVLVTAGLLIIGGMLVLNQEMNIGQFVAAEIIILLIISSVEKLILGLESIYDVLTSLEKLGQVVDKELEPQVGEDPFYNPLKEFKLELENLCYGTKEKKKIINDITFSINSKSRILIQGPSGSGKSSLLRVLAGIVDPTEGDMFVNGISMKGVQKNFYRSKVGQSLAEESPFEGTILENITFGDASIDRETIYWALDNLGLTEYIKELPHGINTILYPEGKQIPNSVSKKIILARSIVVKPNLMLLRDPLQNFEDAEVRRIMDFLTHKDRPWGLVVVSENERWLKGMTTIISLEEGKITNIKNL